MQKKEDNNKHTFKALSINFGLVESIAEALPSSGKPGDKSRRKAIAYNMLTLGKLAAEWKDIVGRQLASKTYPYKLIKGKLYLSVSDSQWMQTLMFVKSQIISKISEKMPKLKVTEIIGKIGIIPEKAKKLAAEAEWPDWQKEKPADVGSIEDKELSDRIARCSQKTAARIKGLSDLGYRLCSICRAVPTRSPDGICAMCLFKSREEARLKTERLIGEMPWMTYEEACESNHDLQRVEYEDIKSRLFAFSLKLIDELGRDLAAEYDEETFNQMNDEMIRAVMLRTGCMPHEVDLDHLPDNSFPEKWNEYLKIGRKFN